MDINKLDLSKYTGLMLEVQDKGHDRILRGIVKSINIINGYLVIETEKMMVRALNAQDSEKSKYVVSPEKLYKIAVEAWSKFKVVLNNPKGTPVLIVSNQLEKSEDLLFLDKESTKSIGKFMGLL